LLPGRDYLEARHLAHITVMLRNDDSDRDIPGSDLLLSSICCGSYRWVTL
jgi:hypothetical protein